MLSVNRWRCIVAIPSRFSATSDLYAPLWCKFPAIVSHNVGHVQRLPLRRCFLWSPVRAASTTASVRLEDLPQGVLPLDPLPLEDEGPAYPTVVLQARNNMRKFENCVLLTRVGGFYELYFEHAEEFGPLLNLKVAQKRTNAGSVSMVSISNPCPTLCRR